MLVSQRLLDARVELSHGWRRRRGRGRRDAAEQIGGRRPGRRRRGTGRDQAVQLKAELGAVPRAVARSISRRRRRARLREQRVRGARAATGCWPYRYFAQLDARVERDVENLRRDPADREAALSRRRADIKREMDALVLKYEACATEACGAREAFQAAAAGVRARADEEAAQQARQVDDAIRARLEREAKQLGFKMSASPRPRD